MDKLILAHLLIEKEDKEIIGEGNERLGLGTWRCIVGEDNIFGVDIFKVTIESKIYK